MDKKRFYICPNRSSVLFLMLAFTLAAIELFTSPGCRHKRQYNTSELPAGLPAIVNAWQLIDDSAGKTITLTVNSSGTVYGFGGVNNFNGKLKESFRNGKFEFDGAVAATMKYAHGIDRERKFFQILNNIDSWQVNKNGELELCSQGKTLVRFNRLTVTSIEYSKIVNQ